MSYIDDLYEEFDAEARLMERQIEQRVAAAVEAERHACEHLARGMGDLYAGDSGIEEGMYSYAANRIADAIAARGKAKEAGASQTTPSP